MKIICHRGLWKFKNEHNSLKACLNGAQLFDGIEIDLKNHNGEIVLSHNPLVKNQKLVTLKTLFKKSPNCFYALNIKEDGLGPELKKIIKKYKIKKYMCFDLSVPEALKYQEERLTVYSRVGDLDPKPSDIPKVLVVDVFNQQNYVTVFSFLKSLKGRHQLFFISPELHHHDVEVVWTQIKKLLTSSDHTGLLCTDYPEKAEKFFNFQKSTNP